MISLSDIDSFLRGKDHEAVESIAERMYTRAEHQQGTKSSGLSNLEKDSGACALPVDDSQGCSQEQKVKNVTGLILRLQSGVHQLLDEVNGHFAEEAFTGTKEASQAGDGNNIVPEDDSWPGFSGLPVGQPDSAYQFATLPSSSFATADPAATPVASPSSYDALSPQTETKLAYLSGHMEQLLGGQWGDGQITECRNQSNQLGEVKKCFGVCNDIKSLTNENPDKAEALMTTSVSDSQQTAATTRWRAGNFSCYTGWRAGNFLCYTGLYESKRFLKGKPYLMRTVQHLPPPGTKYPDKNRIEMQI